MEKSKIAELMKKLKIPKPWPAGFYLKPEGKRILKALIAENLSSRDIAKVLGKSYGAILNIYTHAGISLPGKLVAKNSKNGSKIKEKIKEEELAKFSAQLKKEERSWPEPEILEVSEEAWHLPGTRRGYASRWDYKGSGYRSGIILQDCIKFAEEGCHFNGVAGGVISKEYIKKELRRRFKAVKPGLRDNVTEHFLNESAKELASVVPKIKKPVSAWVDPSKPEFVRFYISTSRVYDGPYSERYESTYGEEIARRLQILRPDDIRLENEGSTRLEVKGVGETDWVISPMKHRLPSKYHSAAAEREIEDKSGQSDQPLPDLWVVGTPASAIHKTSGEKERSYITLPASCRLEATTVAENQEGVAIVESVNGNRFVRFWNFKDLIHKEKRFITGIKEDSIEIHKKIVDIIKNHGAMTIGLLADKLEIDRQTVEREIKFLEEPKMLTRKTWPGLYYNPKSQRYDFHLDWLQERLRYGLPKEYLEDTFLFFGCLHAGYTTTDYEHFIVKYPEIILTHKVKILVGLGDFIAGLVHNMMHRGEIVGALNNTDQEIFAAELVSTIMFKSFKKLFEEALSKFSEVKPTAEELKSIINSCLVDFIYIRGNHDDWQLREGTTPLVTFRDTLLKILYREIGNLFSVHGLVSINFSYFIEKKIIELPDFAPVYQLPSGLTLGARHPGMARADTTSLRAQKALDALGTQIVGIANFHVATTVHKWRPDLGQCVAAQAATQVIYTPFEGSKMKKLDFGPIFLRVLSHDKRIYMDETAYFNKPTLKKPLLKWIDVDKLKDSLGLLRA
ncbi:MAG TPA: HTH domain-containing protein [Candidatus Paceibacterota bacterium]